VPNLFEIKSRQPIREQVEFELRLGLFDNFFNELLHFVDLTRLGVANR